jgi:hypothetical protein
MKKYSYNLFPKPLVVTGYLLLILAFVLFLINLNSGQSENLFNDFVVSLAITFVGLIMISFRSKIIIDDKSGFVLKESGLSGLTLSREKIKIPDNCDKIIIKEKTRRGTGYYRFVLPVSYNFKSYDMFFHSERGIIRLINTDCRRAIKIAEFFKTNMKLDYILELTQ